MMATTAMLREIGAAVITGHSCPRLSSHSGIFPNRFYRGRVSQKVVRYRRRRATRSAGGPLQNDKLYRAGQQILGATAVILDVKGWKAIVSFTGERMLGIKGSSYLV